jgi:hypothetical protein
MLQVSDCTVFYAFCVMLQSIAAFCSEDIERSPGVALRCVFKAILVAPVANGMIVHFMLHIRCVSIHKLLYSSFLFASLCKTVRSHWPSTYFSLFCQKLLSALQNIELGGEWAVETCRTVLFVEIIPIVDNTHSSSSLPPSHPLILIPFLLLVLFLPVLQFFKSF